MKDADELLEDARDHVTKAVKSLVALLYDDPYGSYDYKEEAIERFHECLNELNNVKKRL